MENMILAELKNENPNKTYKTFDYESFESI